MLEKNVPDVTQNEGRIFPEIIPVVELKERAVVHVSMLQGNTMIFPSYSSAIAIAHQFLPASAIAIHLDHPWHVFHTQVPGTLNLCCRLAFISSLRALLFIRRSNSRRLCCSYASI
jgi:hypothetical protein